MDISLFRSVANQYEHLRGINTVSMMNTISHLIEDQVIEHRLPVDFYAGFQKFSNFPEQMRRYGRLGAICRRVYVLGIPDCQPPSIPGVEFIELQPGSELSREWFLLVNTPDFWATLLAREVEGREYTTGQRRFDGLWSYDTQVVERISLLLTQVLGKFYDPVQRRDHERQSQHINEISGSLLAQLEQAEETIQKYWKRLCTLQKLAEISSQRSPDAIQQIADVFDTILGATGAVIVLRKSQKQSVVAAASGQALERGQMLTDSSSVCAQTIEQSRSIHVGDVTQHFQSEPLLPTAKSLLSYPIVSRQTFGAIAIGSDEPHVWENEDIRMLTVAAQLIAGYLQQNIQISPKTTFSLNPDKRFQQYMSENRRSLSHLLAMHQKLRLSGDLNPHQTDVLNKLEKAYQNLIAANKLAKRLLEAPPPAPKATSQANSEGHSYNHNQPDGHHSYL